MRRRYSHHPANAESASSQTVDIEVSGEQPAEFIDAPVETTAPGELPTTEAPEAIDYDGRVEDVANNENIYATFTQHLRNIYTTFCNARTH